MEQGTRDHRIEFCQKQSIQSNEHTQPLYKLTSDEKMEDPTVKAVVIIDDQHNPAKYWNHFVCWRLIQKLQSFS